MKSTSKPKPRSARPEFSRDGAATCGAAARREPNSSACCTSKPAGPTTRPPRCSSCCLADAYRRNAQWELAEATLMDLVERLPDEPATFDGMQWLFQYWTSAELTYQRLRKESVQTSHVQINPRRCSRRKSIRPSPRPQSNPRTAIPVALEGPIRCNWSRRHASYTTAIPTWPACVGPVSATRP